MKVTLIHGPLDGMEVMAPIDWQYIDFPAFARVQIYELVTPRPIAVAPRSIARYLRILPDGKTAQFDDYLLFE